MRGWLSFTLLSVLVHGALASSFLLTDPTQDQAVRHVQVRVVATKSEPEPVVLAPAPETSPPPAAVAEVPPRPEAPPPPPRSERVPEDSPRPSAEPVQGLAPSAVTTGSGAGISVPLGNTLMREDRGIRLSADKVVDLPQDLSVPPQLILASMVRPEYTEEALDVELEGVFEVAVYVDSDGNVLSAELERRIGYGMDARVIGAAKSARFRPARDRSGRNIAQWSYIRFALQID